jgi:hypothetical protein
LGRTRDAVEAIESEEKEAYDKYEGILIQEERAIKLMARVGARIL